MVVVVAAVVVVGLVALGDYRGAIGSSHTKDGGGRARGSREQRKTTGIDWRSDRRDGSGRRRRGQGRAGQGDEGRWEEEMGKGTGRGSSLDAGSWARPCTWARRGCNPAARHARRLQVRGDGAGYASTALVALMASADVAIGQAITGSASRRAHWHRAGEAWRPSHAHQSSQERPRWAYTGCARSDRRFEQDGGWQSWGGTGCVLPGFEGASRGIPAWA